MPTSKPKKNNVHDLEIKLAEAQEARLRLAADYQNLEKRFVQEREKLSEQAVVSVLEELFPIFDNFYRSSSHAPEIGDTNELSPEQIAKIVSYINGLKMIEHQMEELLARLGLTRIASKGELFDPNLHEAISYEPSKDVPADYVIDEVEAGWQIGDSVIRPAKVRVSQG
jgi:molecular chaperone GrpE